MISQNVKVNYDSPSLLKPVTDHILVPTAGPLSSAIKDDNEAITSAKSYLFHDISLYYRCGQSGRK